MTTWLHCSPGKALLLAAAASSFNLIFYFVMDRSAIHDRGKITAYNTCCQKADYSLIHDEKEMTNTCHQEQKFFSSEDEENETGISRTKYQAICNIFPYIIFLFLEYLLGDLIINSVVTTLAFSNAPFSQRDHFVYYYLTLVFSLFISRSYLPLLMWLSPNNSRNVIIENLRVFSVLVLIIAACFIFCFCAVWFRFLNNVGYVFLVILVLGNVSGTIDSNALCSIKSRADPKNKLFLLGQASIGIAVGHMISGIVGLFLEPFLRMHCFEVSANVTYCYTRPN